MIGALRGVPLDRPAGKRSRRHPASSRRRSPPQRSDRRCGRGALRSSSTPPRFAEPARPMASPAGSDAFFSRHSHADHIFGSRGAAVNGCSGVLCQSGGRGTMTICGSVRLTSSSDRGARRRAFESRPPRSRPIFGWEREIVRCGLPQAGGHTRLPHWPLRVPTIAARSPRTPGNSSTPTPLPRGDRH